MDIYWYGQACFKIKGKTTTVIIDPFDPDFVGLKLPKDLEGDMVLLTHAHKDHSNAQAVMGNPVKIDGPGEYEIKGVAIAGIGVYHDKQKGAERGKNTIYNVEIDGLNIVHLGDLGHTLTEEQIEEIGLTDVLLVPVGGTFTIDAKDASEVCSQLEPKVIIPMHYGIEGLKFSLDKVDAFLKEQGIENIEPLSKLSATKDKLPEEPIVVVLNKS